MELGNCLYGRGNFVAGGKRWCHDHGRLIEKDSPPTTDSCHSALVWLQLRGLRLGWSLLASSQMIQAPC